MKKSRDYGLEIEKNEAGGKFRGRDVKNGSE